MVLTSTACGSSNASHTSTIAAGRAAITAAANPSNTRPGTFRAVRTLKACADHGNRRHRVAADGRPRRRHPGRSTTEPGLPDGQTRSGIVRRLHLPLDSPRTARPVSAPRLRLPSALLRSRNRPPRRQRSGIRLLLLRLHEAAKQQRVSDRSVGDEGGAVARWYDPVILSS